MSKMKKIRILVIKPNQSAKWFTESIEYDNKTLLL